MDWRARKGAQSVLGRSILNGGGFGREANAMNVSFLCDLRDAIAARILGMEEEEERSMTIDDEDGWAVV